MKRGMILFSMVAMLAVSARCQTAMIALDDIPGTTLVCVTNYGPQVVSLTARVTGLEGSSNDWSKTVSNLAALSNNVSALSSRVTATNALFSAWFAGLQSRTSYWDAAYSWGDWAVAVGANTAAIAVLQTNTVTRAGTNGFVTASITNGLASTSYVAAAVAAIPAAYAFWPPNATASSRFNFVTNSGAITITGYNISGGTDVVIPDYINGLPVTEIGENAFSGSGVTSIGGAGNVVGVGYSAFFACYSLTSVSLPQAQAIAAYALWDCDSLTSVYFDNDAPTIGADIFGEITPNQVKIYVTNPQATGWGATLGGMPVVRLPLYGSNVTAQAFTLGGDTITEWPVGVAELDPVANAALAVHTNRIDNPHSVTAAQIGAITAEADPVAGPRLDRIEAGTNAWNAAYSWGDHALAGYLLPSALSPYATTAALVVHTNRADNPHGVTAVQIGAITAELDPVANAALVVHTNRVDNPHGVTAVQIGALTAELDPVANAALVVHTNRVDNPHGVTAVQIGALTAELDPVANAALVVHTNRVDNPHGVTAVQIGALTAETDTAALAALAAYAAYWPPNATASSWFNFVTNSGAITITGYNIAGGTDVVIPDYINGLPVTEIGANAFHESGVTSIGGAGNVVTVEDYAISGCASLTSVLLPQVQTLGVGAFYYCSLLTSVYFDNDAPTIGPDTFGEIPPNQVTNYVTNPQATGWSATLGGMPVVRLPLYADAIYQAGELVATEAHVAQAIAAIPEPDLSDHPTFSQIAASNALPYTAWTGTVTPVNGIATVTIAHGNMPVLVTTAPCVLTLDPTGYGTSGVSRVSLSYYTGGNSFTFSTDVIQYAETPTVDTSGWNTLLIRRVSNGAWKGVGL